MNAEVRARLSITSCFTVLRSTRSALALDASALVRKLNERARTVGGHVVVHRDQGLLDEIQAEEGTRRARAKKSWPQDAITGQYFGAQRALGPWARGQWATS